MKTLKQLFEQFKVKADFNHIESNLVYPMDVGTKYTFHGYVNNEELEQFFVRCMVELNSKYLCNRIANKYAIPFLQVGHMHYITTFFYYQHDNKVWLISLKETTTEYLG